MKAANIELIFFDAGGVLLEYVHDPRDILAEHFKISIEKLYAAHDRSLKHDLKFSWDEVNSWEREVEFSQYAAEALLDELNIPRSAKETDFIASQWLNRQHKLIKGAIEALDYLCPNYRLAMITNAPPSRRTRELVNHDLLKYFDPIVISGELGMRKPDPLIFMEALNLASIEARKTAFIDDFPGYLEAAQQVGIKLPILFDRSGQKVSPFRTIKELTELRQIF